MITNVVANTGDQNKYLAGAPMCPDCWDEVRHQDVPELQQYLVMFQLGLSFRVGYERFVAGRQRDQNV